MGTILFVEGLVQSNDNSSNFSFNDYYIDSFSFITNWEDSEESKSIHESGVHIKVIGIISKIIQDNKSAIEEIRKWVRLPYTDKDYYKKVMITQKYSDNTVRKISFSKAYIKWYEENYDVNVGSGKFTIVFAQKEFMVDEVEI